MLVRFGIFYLNVSFSSYVSKKASASSFYSSVYVTSAIVPLIKETAELHCSSFEEIVNSSPVF